MDIRIVYQGNREVFRVWMGIRDGTAAHPTSLFRPLQSGERHFLSPRLPPLNVFLHAMPAIHACRDDKIEVFGCAGESPPPSDLSLTKGQTYYDCG